MHIKSSLIGAAVLVTFCPAMLGAQTVIRPDAKITKTSFAVITDTPTWESCSGSMKAFADQLGSEDLPTFIVHSRWKSPEQVKKVIKDLHRKHSLEGVMLVGDIPVAMIRKAQHLTSAFKMDETTDWWESSVPSDRFYDDFHLKFDYIRPDSTHAGFFYYDLAADSPSQIKCDIYSARVKPVTGPGTEAIGTPAEQIDRFFNKAIAEHCAENRLDQFYSHTGEGSYSNSLNAWTSEAATIREQMPGTFDSPASPGRARFTRYSFAPYPKDDIINQLVREDLDLTIFHEHGVPDRQYISSIPTSDDLDDHVALYREMLRNRARRVADSPEKLADLEAKNRGMGLDSAWWADYADPAVIKADSITDADRGILLPDITAFKPNSRMVIFDACYNGDFREDDCIASRYIFADGKTVATFANSVNVLQDKQANEMLGLLWLGARVGQWAQETNILESHILGDPTHRFTPSANGVDASEICRAKYNETDMRALLDSPYADMRNLAMHRLWRGGATGLSQLYADTFRNSPVAMERYTALSLLEKLNDDNYRDLLPTALADANEFIRRTTVSRMGRVGRDEYVADLVAAYFDDTQAERVVFQIENNLQAFSPEAVDKALGERKCARTDKLRKAFGRQTTANEGILGDGAESKWRKLYIKSLRNNNIHASLTDYLAILDNPAEEESLKLILLDALAWYNQSYRRDEILTACDRLRRSTKSKALRNQALRTINRLKQ